MLIKAIVEDLTGTTNAVSINVIGLTNSDGSMNSPVQLQAAPVAGFSPLSVAFTVSANAPGTLQQVCYDFNGDDIADFITNTLGTVAYTYATNGEYFPVVTLQTSAGNFSSVGGWNAVVSDPSNQPVQINVQTPATQSSFLSSFSDPVDLKWDGTNLYVLSGSSGTITEFTTNGSSIGSPLSIGASCSGFDVDAVGNIYVAVTASNQVWKFFPTNGSFVADTNFGTGGFVGDTNGAAGSDTNVFNAPYDVAVSPDGGTISVSDTGNNRIEQFSTVNGAFIATFGSVGNAVGQFTAPEGLTYDSAGILYIVDTGNNRIALAQSSEVVGVSGTNGMALGQFSSPVNISVGERGVSVADTGNNRIQSFKPLGNGVYNFAPSDIRFGFSTNFSGPFSVAAVNDLMNDKFYVADTANNRVVLCNVPGDSPDILQALWDDMKNRVANGDLSGAARDFCSDSADNYFQSFLVIGASGLASDINQIGALTPVFIRGDAADFYFEKNIEGQTILFPVELMKENGVWKIVSF